ncbi:class I SAM-dependent methyltransferase [Sulfurovum mangrovi]|uniref:class I SAM-dependent methyltransferase n=1 Tax=Sulfurovum mangrovi TaxID=2893889 RepID=UPI001E48B92E|nr:class I SAM-dependent methyltransferase [Sulfurovum mangrovi]UFH60453.1 class I SAM-dependent methyltransferase [Sulfurovum mangrovi]
MWDQRYDQDEFVYGTNPNDFLKDNYHTIPQGGRVLCLAEGEGRNAVFLALQGYQVTAMDQSKVGLQKAKALAEKNGVEIETVVSDLEHFDLGENVWDGIVSIFAHVPPSIRIKLHQQVRRALKKEGVFILEGFTPRQPKMSGMGGPPPSQKALFMSLESLKEELSGLDFSTALERERELSEGKHHEGLCSVVQIVALKV